MKAANLIVFVVLVAAVSCHPDSKGLIAEEISRQGTCSTNIEDCASVPYSPVCAGKPGQWPKSFGSTCALNVYNCIHKECKALKVISSGRCSGSGGW